MLLRLAGKKPIEAMQTTIPTLYMTGNLSAVDGRLSHQDSMGNKESLERGAVQYLSAGTGITHSEMNDHPEVCRFLQVRILRVKKLQCPNLYCTLDA